MTRPTTNTLAAAAYYDDPDVSDFYRLCWGGSDIHIGRYDKGNETIAEASAAMTRYLLEQSGVSAGDRVLDIACGYGGTLRMLAAKGCRPKGIDISRVCVDEARKSVDEAGLADVIKVDIGDFHAIDSDAGVWDAAICQESIIHSTDRPRVFSEVYRVLRCGGVFAISDILTTEDADSAMVEAAFARLGVEEGATSRGYQAMAIRAGFEIEHVEERPGDIATHYEKLAEILAEPADGLGAAAAALIAQSIARWQAAIAGGHITWACFIARKPA